VVSRKAKKLVEKIENFFNTGRGPHQTTTRSHVASHKSSDFSPKKRVLRGHRRSNPCRPASRLRPLTTTPANCLCPYEIFVLTILCSSNFEISIWVPKRIQMKKLSTRNFYNFSRSTTFILVVSPSEVVYKI